MGVEPATLNIRADGQRMVWVENRGSQDYHENFRGRMISIPAHGRIEMRVLEANRFLGQPKAPAVKLANGKFAPGMGPKPLHIVEMTAAETEEQEGITPEQRRLSEKAEEEKLALTCVSCGFRASSPKGLKIHSATKHPDLVPNDT